MAEKKYTTIETWLPGKTVVLKQEVEGDLANIYLTVKGEGAKLEFSLMRSFFTDTHQECAGRGTKLDRSTAIEIANKILLLTGK